MVMTIEQYISHYCRRLEEANGTYSYETVREQFVAELGDYSNQELEEIPALLSTDMSRAACTVKSRIRRELRRREAFAKRALAGTHQLFGRF